MNYFDNERRYFIKCDCGAYDWVYESNLSCGKKRGCNICTWSYSSEERDFIIQAARLREQTKSKGISRQQQSIFDVIR